MDLRLRELERRWRETGDPVDGAAWLRERVRTGNLAEERLVLAGCCGHEAARLAVELPEDWLEAVERLDRLAGPGVAFRFAAAMARLCVGEERWAGGHSIPDGSTATPVAAEAVLGAIEAWLRCPCRDHVLLASGVPTLLFDPHVRRKRQDVLPAWAALVAWHLFDGQHREGGPGFDWPSSPLRELAKVTHRLREPGAIAAVRADLATWALGTP